MDLYGTLGKCVKGTTLHLRCPTCEHCWGGKNSGQLCFSNQVVTKPCVARLAHACRAIFQMLVILSEAGRRAWASNLGRMHAPCVFATPEVGPSCVNEKHTSFCFLVYYQLSNFRRQQHRWCHRVLFYPLMEGEARAGAPRGFCVTLCAFLRSLLAFHSVSPCEHKEGKALSPAGFHPGPSTSAHSDQRLDIKPYGMLRANPFNKAIFLRWICLMGSSIFLRCILPCIHFLWTELWPLKFISWSPIPKYLEMGSF